MSLSNQKSDVQRRLTFVSLFTVADALTVMLVRRFCAAAEVHGTSNPTALVQVVRFVPGNAKLHEMCACPHSCIFVRAALRCSSFCACSIRARSTASLAA